MENRKGARKIEEVPADVLLALNRGDIPTVNLVESLAMNQIELLQHTLPNRYHSALLKALTDEGANTYLKQAKCIGSILCVLAQENNDQTLLPFLINHPSDTLRCWAAIFIGSKKVEVLDKLQEIKQLAADQHFGVREIAWIAVREDILNAPEESIQFLTPWIQSEDENIRRFACESIRPKGVWCRQFKWIQEHPEAVLPIIDALKDDSAKYVQDSVANWLNDLSKTNPSWVRTITDSWLADESISKARAYICKRATRSL